MNNEHFLRMKQFINLPVMRLITLSPGAVSFYDCLFAVRNIPMKDRDGAGPVLTQLSSMIGVLGRLPNILVCAFTL